MKFYFWHHLYLDPTDRIVSKFKSPFCSTYKSQELWTDEPKEDWYFETEVLREGGVLLERGGAKIIWWEWRV